MMVTKTILSLVRGLKTKLLITTIAKINHQGIQHDINSENKT